MRLPQVVSAMATEVLKALFRISSGHLPVMMLVWTQVVACVYEQTDADSVLRRLHAKRLPRCPQ